ESQGKAGWRHYVSALHDRSHGNCCPETKLSSTRPNTLSQIRRETISSASIETLVSDAEDPNPVGVGETSTPGTGQTDLGAVAFPSPAEGRAGAFSWHRGRKELILGDRRADRSRVRSQL